MSAVVVYLGDWPPETRAVVEPLVAASTWMLPPWVWELFVTYTTDDVVSATATMESRAEYGQAFLGIGPEFLSRDAGGRASVIRHEMAHVLVAPLVTLAEDIRSSLGRSEPALAEYFNEELRRAMERVTAGIERVLNDRLGEATP